MPIAEAKAHDYLLEGLSNIDSIASIKLVSRLYNTNIGNESPDRLYIFFPDTHIIRRQRRKDLKWHGFNHERVFVDLLKKIIELRKAAPGIKFHVMQLGDFLDLWRIKDSDPEKVMRDYSGVTYYMYEGGSERSADARFVIGNHDGWMAQKPLASSRWYMSFFFPDQPRPPIYVTHGDIFDEVEKIPDEVKAFFVYHSTGNFLEKIFGGDDSARKLGILKKFWEERCRDVGDDGPIKLGTPRISSITDSLGNSENVMNRHKFLDAAMDRVATFDGTKINAAVTAHTHQARIAVDEASGFTLMDVGAWIGEYESDEGNLPCCQMGVVCGNDFRIYQFDPDTAKSKRFEEMAVE